jgi:hypothetical protein
MKDLKKEISKIQAKVGNLDSDEEEIINEN